MLTMRDLIPWSRGREMSPGKRDYDHPVVAFQREMDRLFDEFWRGFDLPVFGGTEGWGGTLRPRIDVSEDDKTIRVVAELPGLKEDDVEVVVADNRLTIKGEKKIEREEAERGYTYRERSFGAFHRSIPLDVDLLSEDIEATFEDGVLTVILPKSEEAKKRFRTIPIKAAPKAQVKHGKSESKAA